MKGTLVTDADGTTYFMFHCPGCDDNHGPVVKRTNAPRPLWGWNESMTAPTFTPSLLVRSGHYAPGHLDNGVCWCTYNAARPDQPAPFRCYVCHSFVTDGRIQFLDDCTHSLKGQTVEIPEWEP